VPSLIGPVAGCAFANRCSEVREACLQALPPQVQLDAQHAVRCVAAQPSHMFSEAA